MKGELGAFYRQLTVGLEGGCTPLSAALSSIQGRGNQVCGGQQRQHRANGGDITSGVVGRWCNMRWVAMQKRQWRDAERTTPVCEKRSAGEWPLAVRATLISTRSVVHFAGCMGVE